MTRQEFLEALSTRLSEEKSTSEVLGLIQYYQGYIDGETARGRTEEEVLDELGDPVLIARTLLEAPSSSSGFFGAYQDGLRDSYEEGAYEGSHAKTHEELMEEIANVRQRTEARYAASRAASEEAAHGKPFKEPEESSFHYQGGHTESTAPPEFNETPGGLLRDEAGSFNWALVALVLAGIMLFVAVIWLVTKVVSIFGPVALIILAALLIIRTVSNRNA